MIALTEHPINYEQVTEAARDSRAGAVVLFLGTVREFTGDAQTVALDYEAYRDMAETKMRELQDEASRRFPVIRSAIVHRVGSLTLGDVCVAIAVSTPHRAEAFAAGRWIIDTLKEQVPIWKRENYVDGRVEWVHPVNSETGEDA